MIHKPIAIQDISFSFGKKNIFQNFSHQIFFGDRIAIIGKNGSGKSTLLKLLQNHIEAESGKITIPDDVKLGYVQQIIETKNSLSGGEIFNHHLTKVLSNEPNVLILDEPTNHLDKKNYNGLMKMLNNYRGTLIVVSHNMQLLNNCINTLLHIHQNKIHIFSGLYSDYIREVALKRSALEKNNLKLKHQKKEMHHNLMKEQERVKKRKTMGEKKYSNDKSSLRAAQSSGQDTKNKNNKHHNNKKKSLLENLSNCYVPEIITPKFSLTEKQYTGVLISINNGCIGYNKNEDLIKNICLSVNSQDRIAIIGNNASGKTTFLKCLLGNSSILKKGEWTLPMTEDIGYLDQHYSNLDSEVTVFNSLFSLIQSWTETEVRKHLNMFLFRKNEEVNTIIKNLSGGEKARVSLALIAARPPKLLILDEVTNNLDIETKEHVVQILKHYKGAMIVVSHEEFFLKEIEIKKYYKIQNSTISEVLKIK